MSATQSHTISCHSLDETIALAGRLAPHCDSPAVLLLHGEIGAGKSAFARAFLRAAGVTDQDIPSPTFTLVQTYDSPAGPIWHSDLYRLSSVDEVEELGLLAAFEDAICLVEWPDRLADEAPQDALNIRFETTDDVDARRITLATNSPRWASALKALT